MIDRLLQEDGSSRILLEDGRYILLETSQIPPLTNVTIR